MSEFVAQYRTHRLTTGLIALLSACALILATVLGAAAAWATTVLVVPGTGTPNPAPVKNYEGNAISYYVAPTGACASGCTATPVPYLAQFWPVPLAGWGGLQGAKWDDSVASGVRSLDSVYGAADKTQPIVIFGYSQGGTVVSQVKQQLSEQPGGVPSNVQFVLIGNASRPNGGLFSRPSFLGHIPILDVTFGPGTPTNTSTTVNTTDVAFQYDGVADFPRYPLNPLATANAIAGFWYVHGKYLAPKADDAPTDTPIGYTPDEVRAAVAAATENCTAATYCQVSGDTRYVTLPAKILPIMLPLLDLGSATGTTALVRPVVDLVSPVTRVLIETGYTRDDYGRPTPFGLVPTVDPLKLAGDLAGAAVTGVTAAATGTGDASRYLAPKTPATPIAPQSAETRVSTTESADRPLASVAQQVIDTAKKATTPSPKEMAPSTDGTAPSTEKTEQTGKAPATPKTASEPAATKNDSEVPLKTQSAAEPKEPTAATAATAGDTAKAPAAA